MNTFHIIAVVSIIICLFLFLNYLSSSITRHKPKLPLFPYKLIYKDQKSESDFIRNDLLFCEKYNLQGKPDLIYENTINKRLIPIELKSGNIKGRMSPYEGDLMQLIAYFLIIEEVYEIKPKFGFVIYNDFMFKIKNTDKYRKRLLNILQNMRIMLKTGEADANASFILCKHCICKGTVCEQ